MSCQNWSLSEVDEVLKKETFKGTSLVSNYLNKIKNLPPRKKRTYMNIPLTANNVRKIIAYIINHESKFWYEREDREEYIFNMEHGFALEEIIKEMITNGFWGEFEKTSKEVK